MQPIHCVESTLHLAAKAGSDVSHGPHPRLGLQVVPQVNLSCIASLQPPPSTMGGYVTLVRFWGNIPSVTNYWLHIDASPRCTDDAVGDVAGVCYSLQLCMNWARRFGVVCRLRQRSYCIDYRCLLEIKFWDASMNCTKMPPSWTIYRDELPQGERLALRLQWN